MDDWNCDCGSGSGSGDCDCCSDDCFRQCCCCMCELCAETDCCGTGSRPSTNCCVACRCSPSTKCCCRFVTALTTIAIATLVAMLVVAYAVAFPARVTVEDAYLNRLALTDGANGTALAYDASLTIAVRNRNFATGAWRTAPLYAELRFRGQTFARARAQLESAEWGFFKAKGKGVYRVTASSSDSGAPVVLGGDGVVAEFVKESVAGVFELELALVGGEIKYEERHGRDSSVSVTCPLKLSLPTATATVAFTSVKCT